MDLYDILLQKQVDGGEGSGSEPVIESLSVTENGTYEAPSGVDGYSPVTVNVSGITPSDTIQITQNGTVDVTQYATADVNVSGGASNFVQGEFNTGTTKNTNILVNVPYTGNGYPIAGVFVIKGGMYNDSAGGNTDWYNLVQRYAIGRWSFVKTRMNTVPTYAPYRYDDPNAPDNRATVSATSKDSTSSATNYVDGGNATLTIYTSDNASDSRDGAIKFKSNTQFQVHVAGVSSWGLLDNTDYEYFIVYSS